MINKTNTSTYKVIYLLISYITIMRVYHIDLDKMYTVYTVHRLFVYNIIHNIITIGIGTCI